MNTITKKTRKRIYKTKKSPVFVLRTIKKEGVGTIVVYCNGETRVVQPTENYKICSRLIDKIFSEKVRKDRAINKENITQYVA